MTSEELLRHTNYYPIFFSGSLACSLGIVTVAAPLSKLVHVIRTNSSECLPFPMIVMSFFVSSLWFFYGLIVEDAYLLVILFYILTSGKDCLMPLGQTVFISSVLAALYCHDNNNLIR